MVCRVESVGLPLSEVEAEFGKKYKDHLLEMAQSEIDDGLLRISNYHLMVTPKGKFLTDGISSRLFLLNLTN